MTTRFPHGVTNADGDSIFADIEVPLPSHPIVYFDDFHRWPEGGLQGADALGVNQYSLNQVTSVADSGDVLPLSVHPDPTGSGGRIRLQTADPSVANDRLGFGNFQWLEAENFNQIWYETLINQRTDSDEIDWIFGVSDVINQLDGNDGVYFKRANGTDAVEIFMRVNSATVFQATVLENFVNNQDYSLAFHYDQQTTLKWEVKSIDGFVTRGQVNVSDLAPPDQSMRASCMVRSTDTVQKQIDIDYFMVISDIERLGSAG